jgi:hypothetical protein
MQVPSIPRPFKVNRGLIRFSAYSGQRVSFLLHMNPINSRYRQRRGAGACHSSVNEVHIAKYHRADEWKINPSGRLDFAARWQTSRSPRFNLSMIADYGLEMPLDTVSDKEAAYWKALDATAGKDFLDFYPSLVSRPKVISRNNLDTPFSLFGTLIPPKLASRYDRSIDFLEQPANT